MMKASLDVQRLEVYLPVGQLDQAADILNTNVDLLVFATVLITLSIRQFRR
ncbi:MAG: hypothetical protein KME49_04750 [Brasilonema octagenarum HA4186-MV1]|jgi:hypothetical protein|uniref:hypothetical protein n=1 Tax=Brasilonema TaxID=383614 RepID=UPI00145D5AD0|nr:MULTISPECIES: hypothetical protein [Brasilonema]MBW4624823.1 hypothetical protein [Brasilonema octagenarum HA4186-MV1]